MGDSNSSHGPSEKMSKLNLFCLPRICIVDYTIQILGSTNKQINALFAIRSEQDNNIINLYTMMTIICAWFKPYVTNIDNWHELV